MVEIPKGISIRISHWEFKDGKLVCRLADEGREVLELFWNERTRNITLEESGVGWYDESFCYICPSAENIPLYFQGDF